MKSDKDHFALRLQKRGGLLGTGTGGERVKARPRAPIRKTEEAVDHRQNNKQCPLVTVVYYAVAVSIAVRNRVTRAMSVALLLRNK